MIQIKNIKYEKPTQPYDIKVCRPSVWGNPFHMRDEFEREKVCKNYKKYFYDYIVLNHMEDLITLMKIGKKYGQLNLFCFCAPKQCHAETIKEWIENYISFTNGGKK